MSERVSYLGNINLKRAGIKQEWTPEQLNEYIKCSKDMEYFLTNYIKIVHVDKGLIPFNMYAYQKKIANTVETNRFVLCKQPRQSGKTTVIAGIILWYVLFNEDYMAAILAHKHDQSREILSRIQLAYEYIPLWMQQGVIEWNKGSIELENGSKIITAATDPGAIRGRSVNFVYLDEFAFVPANMQEDFFASVFPTISSGTTTRVVISSTPNGLNLFYKLWVDSEQGRNDYIRIDVHWSETPGRDEAWKIETIKNTSEDQFRVEFECEFVGSSNTLIHPKVLRQLTYIEPIKSDNFLKIYEPVKEKHMYVSVVDTSRGGGGDYSVFVIIDVTQAPYKIVATYRNNLISPLLFPNIIYELAKRYNNASVLIETNDIGQQVADILYLELEYEHVLASQNSGRAGQRLSEGFGTQTHKGVRTTKAVKKTGCSVLKTLVESQKLIINDYQVLYELFRFISKGQSFEAEEGTDDLVMCCVLFGWLANQPLFKELTDFDIRLNIVKENEKKLEEDLVPFGIVVDGSEDNTEEDTVKVVPSLDVWLSS